MIPEQILGECEQVWITEDGEMEDESSYIKWSDAVKAMKSYATENLRGNMIALLDWYEKLNPTDKVSMWSKNGDAKGLFNMDNTQLVDKYLDRLKKIPKE